MSNKAALTLDSLVTHSDEQVSCEIDGTVALMSVKNGEYYKFDEIGSRIWTALEKPRRVQDLCELLVSSYNVNPEDCRSDVFDFLNNLLDDGLIRIA